MKNSSCSSDSSIKFLPCRTEEPSKTIAQSPASTGSQPQQQDLSSGPQFEEPVFSQGPKIVELKEQQPDRNGDPTKLALVQVPLRDDKSLPLQGKSDDAVELREWSIRFVLPCRSNPSLGFPNFILLGTREDHPRRWQSSIVIRVESAQILYTSSSTKYRLVGEIDIMDCASAGFPKDFVSMFLMGFPPNWKTQITRLYNSALGHLEVNENIKENRNDYRDEKMKHHLFKDNDDEITDSTEPGPNSYKQNASVNNSIRRKNSSSADEVFVSNPEQPSTSVVRRSRSGRTVRSPLASWAGQRVRYDGAGNVIAVEDVKTPTVHSQGVTKTLTLSNHYGLSPSITPREKFSRIREPMAIGGPKQVSRRGPSVATRGDYENRHRNRKFVSASSSDDEISVRKYGIRRNKVQWDDDEFERQLREERLLFMEGARDLRKMQKNLLLLEQRIAEREAAWLRNKKMMRRMHSHGHVDVEQREKKQQERHYSKKGHQKCYKQVPHRRADEQRRYLEERELERRRLEEWARENEQISSGSEDLNDESWCEPGLWVVEFAFIHICSSVPVRKRKKQSTRKVRVESCSSSELSSLDDEQSDEEGNVGSTRKQEGPSESVVKKEKGWSKAELHRLKLALAAIRVVTDEDWEKVARSLGNMRSMESCKQAAIKRLKWEPPVDNEEPPPITSETVTARAGTIAHQHQTNEYTRKFMLGGGEQSEDFFIQNNVNLSESIVDVAEFGADDSLLEVLRTPVDVVAQRKGPNRRNFIVEPLDDDTPVRRESGAVLMATPTNSAQRERQDRYLYHIMNKAGHRNDVSRLNYTRNTSRLDTFRHELTSKDSESAALIL
ncbi:SANTA protein [Cooperia oncophora]